MLSRRKDVPSPAPAVTEGAARVGASHGNLLERQPSLHMPHSLTHAESMKEQKLEQETRELQAKIDRLELRLHEQQQVVEAHSTHRMSIASSTTHATAGDHLSLATQHASQAVSTAISNCCTAMCTSVVCRCCDLFSGKRTSRVSIAEQPASSVSGPVPGLNVGKAQSGGGDDGESEEVSAAEHTLREKMMTSRKNKLIPSWESTPEKSMKSAKWANTLQGQFTTAPGPKDAVILENHEYILEDEWGIVPTNGVINPRAAWKETWDLNILFLILYSAVMVPYRICFSAEAVGYMWIFEVAVSFVFITDVIFNFTTSYCVDDKWVISHPKIIARYLTGWFWIDAPSSIPVELMTLLLASEETAEGAPPSHLGLLRFLRMFRLLRLLRLLKVDVYIAQIEDQFEINLISLRILGMVSKLMFMVHLLGCFWFYVADTEYKAGETVTWVAVYNDGAALDGPVSRQYLYSIYWALTTLTTVGYGDITPTNDAERYYCLFAMLVGAMMFGYMMSTIGSMVTQMDREAQLKEERMDAVKEWMLSRNVPHKLFVRVRKYYEHYYSRRSAFDEEEIVKLLTPALRSEVTKVLLKDSLGHFPLFAMLGVEFQQHVYPKLKPVAYANMDAIYNKGEQSKDMFFLRRGTVDVLSSGLGSDVLYRIGQGQYFGEEVLTHQRRGCTVLSNGWTEMWSLSRDALEEAMTAMPNLVSVLDDFVITELERRKRLYSLSYRILIACATDPERRAALMLQKSWTAFASVQAKAETRFAPGKRRALSRGMSWKQKLSSGGAGEVATASQQAMLTEEVRELSSSVSQIKKLLESKGPASTRALVA